MRAIYFKFIISLAVFSAFFFFFQNDLYSQLPNTVTIQGSGSNSTQVPFSSTSSYSYSQQIYQASEINYSGDICRLSLRKTSSTDTTIQYIRIALGQVTDNTFSSGLMWGLDLALTPVFEGFVNFRNGWNEIILDTFFTYDGIENLLVSIYYMDTSTHLSQTFATANRANTVLTLNSTSPLDLNSLAEGSLNNQRNHIKFTFDICNPVPIQGGIEFTCGMLFSDPGGNEDYDNDLFITQTFISDNGQPFVIDFYEFSLSDYDCLYIYDGATIASPLLGTFMGNQLPASLQSVGTVVTILFTSNGEGVSSGWVAAIYCQPCTSVSTSLGSPCDGVSLHPFCTEEAPDGLSYPSGSGGDPTSFFGTSSAGCISFSGTPSAWYYMKISQPGNLLIFIEQFDNSGNEADVDFICWGPFSAATPSDFKNNLCCGRYTLYSGSSATHRPNNGDHSNGATGGYPVHNIIDCSFDARSTEWCFIPNAQVGEYYLLLLTNWARRPGTISFNKVETNYTSAETDCSVVSIAGSNSPLCEDDILFLYCGNTEPNSSYYWTGPDNFTSTDRAPIIQNVTAANAGDYTLYLYLANGDTVSTIVPVEVKTNPEITIIAYRDTLCANDTTRLVATGGDSYRWNTSALDTSTIVVAPSTPTYFQVIGTANGCSSAEGVYVYTHPAINSEITQFPNAFCPKEVDHTIIATVSGGTPPLSYQWDGPVTALPSSPTSAQTNLSGAYFCDSLISIIFKTTDSLNCIKRDTTYIRWFDQHIPSIDSSLLTVNAICNNGQYYVPDVISNYRATAHDDCISTDSLIFTQTPVEGTLITETTEVTIRAFDRCRYSNIGIAEVIIPAAPVIQDTVVQHINCYGESTGAITVTITGGWQPLQFQWDDPANSQSISLSNIPAGNYQLTIADPCAIRHTLHFTVQQPDSLHLDILRQNITCENEIGHLQTVVSGGVAPYSYHWNNGSTTPDIQTYAEGWYEVTVSDDHGCLYTVGDSITEPESPTIILEEIIGSTCNENNGSITVSVEGGTPPYQFLWSNGSNNPYELSSLAAGNYSVLITDQVNCSATLNFTIEAHPLTVSIISIQHADCYKNNGSIEIGIHTISDSLEIDWHGIASFSGNSAFNLYPGSYLVSVNDGTCVVDFPFTIQNIPGIDACIRIAPSPPNFCDDNLQFIDCSQDAIYWHWDLGDGYFSDKQHPTHQYSKAGNYQISLLVRDNNDCIDTTNVLLVIKDKTTFYIPNAFTPNQDGLNDIFKPDFISIDPEAFKMSIYDRWGALVFYTENHESGWDGTVNGEIPTMTTLFSYIIQYRDHLGKKHIKKGSVTLLK